MADKQTRVPLEASRRPVPARRGQRVGADPPRGQQGAGAAPAEEGTSSSSAHLRQGAAICTWRQRAAAARGGGSSERRRWPRDGEEAGRGVARARGVKRGMEPPKWARGRASARGNGSTRAGISDGERRGRGKHGYRLSRDEGGESQRRILEDLLEAGF